MLNIAIATIPDTTKQKERLSHSPSCCCSELAVRPDEKESLTLFFFDGISPPSEYKVNQKFRDRRSNCRCFLPLIRDLVISEAAKKEEPTD